MMQEHALQTPRTARYLTLDPLSDAGPEPVAEVWIVVHGYGQLARYALRDFRGLRSPRRMIVAPEALNRFYLDDAHQRVGATWMTREDRIADIADYVAYLDAVFGAVCDRIHSDTHAIPLVVLGFSQGVQTVSRWLDQSPRLASRTRRADRLILWGGAWPHDTDLPTARSWLKDADLTLVAGDRDEYVTPDRLAAQEAALRDADVPFRTIRYEGGHRIDPEILRTRLVSSDA